MSSSWATSASLELCQATLFVTGALAVFGFAQRISGGFQIRYLPASEKIYSEDISESFIALNTGVEKCISYCPEQYQWEYKRFRTHRGNYPKYTTVENLVIR